MWELLKLSMKENFEWANSKNLSHQRVIRVVLLVKCKLKAIIKLPFQSILRLTSLLQPPALSLRHHHCLQLELQATNKKKTLTSLTNPFLSEWRKKLFKKKRKTKEMPSINSQLKVRQREAENRQPKAQQVNNNWLITSLAKSHKESDTKSK